MRQYHHRPTRRKPFGGGEILKTDILTYATPGQLRIIQNGAKVILEGEAKRLDAIRSEIKKLQSEERHVMAIILRLEAEIAIAEKLLNAQRAESEEAE
jgi:hypothetical protein